MIFWSLTRMKNWRLRDLVKQSHHLHIVKITSIDIYLINYVVDSTWNIPFKTPKHSDNLFPRIWFWPKKHAAAILNLLFTSVFWYYFIIISKFYKWQTLHAIFNFFIGFWTWVFLKLFCKHRTPLQKCSTYMSSYLSFSAIFANKSSKIE